MKTQIILTVAVLVPFFSQAKVENFNEMLNESISTQQSLHQQVKQQLKHDSQKNVADQKDSKALTMQADTSSVQK